MSQAAPTRDAILALLGHHPDGLTKNEIAAELGKHRDAVETSISHDRKKHGAANLRILRWEPTRGKGGKESAVYVRGPGKDAARVRRSAVDRHRERKARYLDKFRAIINARQRARRGSRSTNPFSQLMRRANGVKEQT